MTKLESHQRLIIPETALRNLYEFLRKFKRKEFHLCCAEEFSRYPGRLDNLIELSYKHLLRYDNRSEAFHDKKRDGRPTDKRLKRSNLADQFAVRLYEEKRVEVGKSLSFHYVDYNISPFRTTSPAVFDSGAPKTKSGRGGVDVLLANADDKTPIIGEIKAKDDTTLLMALIQALTYAIELATPNQQHRLANAYPGRFQFPDSGPYMDIYLLLVRPPKGKKTIAFHKFVDPLCRDLLSAKFVPTVIRSISCLETDFARSHPVQFDLHFSYRCP
jgi:hypothetical protein